MDSIKTRKKVIIAVCAGILMTMGFTGCGSGGKGDPEPKVGSYSQKASETEASEAGSGEKTQDKALAQRLCGKYSHSNVGEECSTLEVFEFAGNLYALGGETMDETDELEPYSFWAMELVPEKSDALTSTEEEGCNVGVLTFSVMSNFSKYQGAPELKEIRLTEDGLILGDVSYSRDERVSDTFPYLDDGTGTVPGDLEGLWKQRDTGIPCYIEFSGSNIRLYKKSPDREVVFGCGGCEADDDQISVTCSLLGSGGMPYEFSAGYSFGKDGSLELAVEDGNEIFFGPAGKYSFEKINKEDVPIVTLDDVYAAGLDDSRVYDQYALDSKLYYQPFYGVWISAFENRGDAEEYIENNISKGFDLSIVLSSDWENLNPKPHYCVTAGRCETETEAKDLLSKVKAAGYGDSNVKYSGKRICTRVLFTVYDLSGVRAFEDRVLLKGVRLTDQSGTGEDMETDLIIDEDTAFDPSCDMQFFAGYEQGDSVLDWFLRNYRPIENSSDSEDAATALLGVFDVNISGQHIDRYYGSYWWD